MSNEVAKTRRGLTLYDENPFVSYDMVKSKTRRITNKNGDMMYVNGSTGEVTGQAGFWYAKEVDDAQFVKLYVKGVKAFKELTSAGTRVFELLYLEVQKNIGKDQIYLSFTAVKPENSLSQATFTRGMRELIDKGFIAPCPAVGWYWLNPDYMFNGDRLAFVQEYRRAPKKKGEQIPGQMGFLDAIKDGMNTPLSECIPEKDVKW